MMARNANVSKIRKQCKDLFRGPVTAEQEKWLCQFESFPQQDKIGILHELIFRYSSGCDIGSMKVLSRTLKKHQQVDFIAELPSELSVLLFSKLEFSIKPDLRDLSFS